MSNSERIRMMTDEELAEVLSWYQDVGGGLDTEMWLEWLREKTTEEWK